ncbi:reverse transcriptase domain-containing protein [Tanacetum coccineum]
MTSSYALSWKPYQGDSLNLPDHSGSVKRGSTIGELDGQGNDQGVEANGGVGRVLNFSTIIAQQLQNLLPALLAQVGSQDSNQGNGRNQNGDAINDNIQGDVRNVIMNNDRRGCTYKKFLAYNPKEYDGKGGAIVYTRWIEKMESVQDMSGCGDNQDEAIRNRSLKKNIEKRGNGREHSRDRNVKDDNKRSRTRNDYATTANPVRREYTGTTPKCTNYNLHHSTESPCRACFSCNLFGHLAKDCSVVPRMVNPVNARNPTAACGACFECGGTDHFKATCPRLNQAQRPGGGRPNHVVSIDEGQGRRNNGNRACRRAFMLGAEEARQDLNIMMGIESSDLGFSYEIKIASEQLVEIDKVIRGCELEIEGHTFNIDLIPFGSGSFDMIVVWKLEGGMDVVFDGAFGGVGDEEVVVGEGVVVTSSSLEMLTNSCLGGITVSLIFLERLEEEALVEFIVELFEEDEDGRKNEKDGLFNLKENDQSRKA